LFDLACDQTGRQLALGSDRNEQREIDIVINHSLRDRNATWGDSAKIRSLKSHDGVVTRRDASDSVLSF
jgi:hypothetical protein